MSLGLYMDVNVPGAVTRELRRRRIDVLTAQEDGRRDFSDSLLLDRAKELNRVLVTCDSDFFAEAALRQTQNIEFPGIFHAHVFQITIGQFVDDLVLICQASIAADWKDRITRLPL